MNPMAMILGTDWLWPFVLTAMALVALFTGSLVWASAGAGAPHGARRRIWLLTLVIPLAAMALYAALGNPRGLNPRDRHPAPNESAETMVGKLAERLHAQPDNPAGWLMLARSYKVLKRYAESAAAWEHAKDLAWDDVEAMSEWAEARILSQGQRFDRRSQELLARAMSLQADAPGVLMLRALAALDRGDAAAAQKVMTQLRDVYPEGSADRQALDAALVRLAAGQDPRVFQSNPPFVQ
ncbi:tetratricopeptide repeat protein [Ottowia testudinis]|uniref:Cytochrome c-type biogenesis protein H TPR domain-containing protein n=1 Tax=Ottowia testudinis TaxID=2816950 RepID=A0A975CGI2_9BURK|nr:hypothetical protein [Ottowia testudinis]QTD45980.1 hypothetical protein J1M35_03450 [Ottowia testudinis]